MICQHPLIANSKFLSFISILSKSYIKEQRVGLSINCGIQGQIRVITKLPNSEQSYKGKVKTHNYINRQNQSTTGKL